MQEVHLVQDFLLYRFPGYRDLVGSALLCLALLVAMDSLEIRFAINNYLGLRKVR